MEGASGRLSKNWSYLDVYVLGAIAKQSGDVMWDSSSNPGPGGFTSYVNSATATILIKSPSPSLEKSTKHHGS